MSTRAPEAGTLAWLSGGPQLEIAHGTVYAPPGELTMMLEGLGGGRSRVGRRQWDRPSEGPPIARGVTVYAGALDFVDETDGGGETIYAASAIRRRVNPTPQPPLCALVSCFYVACNTFCDVACCMFCRSTLHSSHRARHLSR